MTGWNTDSLMTGRQVLAQGGWFWGIKTTVVQWQVPLGCQRTDRLSIIQIPSLWSELTLYNKVNLGGLGLVLGLDRAGIGPFIIYIHLLNAQTVLNLTLCHQVYAGVQGPLVLTGKDDVGAVKPGHFGHLVIYITPGQRKTDMGFYCNRLHSNNDRKCMGYNVGVSESVW